MTRALAAAISACLVACASPGAPIVAPQPAPQSPARLAQLGYGDAAHFGYCRSADCPQVTPKALAVGADRSADASMPVPTPLPAVPPSDQPPLVAPLP